MLNELITAGRYAYNKLKGGDLATDGVSQSGGLNFMDGFKYQSQNLDDYHNSAQDIKDLRHETMQQHLGIPISNEAPKKETVVEYLKTLNNEDMKIYKHLLDSGYGYNDIVAYMGVKDKYENPMAEGLGIFEPKKREINLNWTPLAGVGVGIGVAEWQGRALSALGKYVQKTQLGETVTDYYQWKEKPDAKDIKKLEGEINGLKNETRELLATGKDDAKLKENYSLIKQKEEQLNKMYELRDKKTAAEVGVEYGVYGDDKNQAKSAKIARENLWKEQVDPIVAKIERKFTMDEVLNSLTKEDLGLTETDWEKTKELIKNELDSYRGKEFTAAEFKKELDKINVSKGFYKGEQSKTLSSNLRDFMHDKGENLLYDELEKVQPGIRNGAIKDYGKLRELELKADKTVVSAINATTEGKTPETVNFFTKPLKWLKNNTIESKAFKSGFGKALELWGKYTTPTNYIKALTNMGVKPEVAEGVVNGTVKAAEATKNVTKKGITKGIKVLGAIAVPLTLYEVSKDIEAAGNELPYLDKFSGLLSKLYWLEGEREDLDMTEADWEAKGLGKEDIRLILEDPDFLDYLSRQSRNGYEFSADTFSKLLE